MTSTSRVDVTESQGRGVAPSDRFPKELEVVPSSSGGPEGKSRQGLIRDRQKTPCLPKERGPFLHIVSSEYYYEYLNFKCEQTFMWNI